MGDLPEIVYRRSVEIIGMTRQLLGKPERMAAHQFLGACGIAHFERLDDDLMISDRAIGTARPWRTAA